MKRAALTLVLLPFVLGCHSNAASPMAQAPGGDKLATHSSTQFGIDLCRELAKSESGKNLCISPASIFTVLSMLYVGSEGTTKTAMAKAMALDATDPASLAESQKHALDQLSNVSDVELKIANAAWPDARFPILPDYLDKVKTNFHAEVSSLKLDQPDALATINGWVKDQTKGKIEKIFDSMPANPVLVVANAVYFKGMWSEQFKAADTHKTTFHAKSGDVSIDMMSRQGDYSMSEGEGFKSALLPYGKGDLAMLVMLPDGSADDLLSKLTPEMVNKSVTNAHHAHGKLSIPKWKSALSVDLKPPLQSMGMQEAFTENANFKGIAADGGIWIGVIKHKSYIDVNEEGTEAAAATGAVVVTKAIQLSQNFTADRPFLYAIVHKPTGNVLFLGKMENPAEKVD